MEIMDFIMQFFVCKVLSLIYLFVCGLCYYICEWGELGVFIFFLFYGWMDVLVLFQFLVDVLCECWYIVVLDWCGYGQFVWFIDVLGVESYWFVDYVVDFEVIIDYYQLEGQVILVGYSLGVNVVCLYVGIWFECVWCVVDLEGFGMLVLKVLQVLCCYVCWFDELKDKLCLNIYVIVEDVVVCLQKINLCLLVDKVVFLVQYWLS